MALGWVKTTWMISQACVSDFPPVWLHLYDLPLERVTRGLQIIVCKSQGGLDDLKPQKKERDISEKNTDNWR